MAALLLFGCVLSLVGLVTPLWTDLDVQSITQANQDTGRPFIIDLRPTRISRTAVGISGTFTFNDDLSKYTAEASIYYSKNGNNAYTQSPIAVAPGPFCDKMNNEYRKFVMNPLANVSDMPCSEKGDLCALLEQRTYTVKNYKPETNKLPKFLQSGIYKIIILVRDATGAVTAELTVLLLLS